ncbi:MAG: general secretion pathway protein GspB, partial [Ramlibacter sp.]
AAAPVPAAPAPAPTATPAPAPSSLAPPFTGGSANRNAPPAVAAAPAPAAAGPQQPVRGLPPDAPKLVISGSVYSPDRAKRVLIVNGQVAHEGADLGQGVVLEEVRHEGAVLGYKGSRYTVVF